MSQRIGILLVEDDTNLSMVLQDYLEMMGYLVVAAADGEEGLQAFLKENVQLCILDVMLPRKDGLTLAREIRKLNPDIPFIFLTAKSQTEDVVNGFKSGCDDYITKPFSSEELSLRLEAILRRCRVSTSPGQRTEVFTFGNMFFDYNNLRLKVSQEEIILTRREADLLLFFCRHVNELMPREMILKAVWGGDSYFAGRSMDVFIARLRKLLKGEPRISITNVHGVGFVFEFKP
ncbi:MAG: response regulator transcription factor [Bacteroidales bacterium]